MVAYVILQVCLLAGMGACLACLLASVGLLLHRSVLGPLAGCAGLVGTCYLAWKLHDIINFING